MIPYPFEIGCDACGAVPGQECLPGCCGYADMIERADGLLGRWMTVRASKLYALLHYSNEAAGR